MLGFAALFTSFSRLSKYAGEKPFPQLNWHLFTFLHPIFNVQGHILSTSGDALSLPKEWSRLHHQAAGLGNSWMDKRKDTK